MIDSHAHVTTGATSYLERAEAAGVTQPVLLSTLVHPERAGSLAQLRTELGRLAEVLGGAAAAQQAHARSQAEVTAALGAWPGAVTMRKVGLDWPESQVLTAAQEAVADPRTVGLGELTPAGGDGAAIEPVLRAAAETAVGRALPVLVHGIAPNGVEDLRAYAALAARYAQVPVVIGAFGGLSSMVALEIAMEIDNIYLDLSSALQTFVVRAALHEVPERCLFGSNTPYGDVLAARAMVEAASSDPGVLERVFDLNARELFGLSG